MKATATRSAFTAVALALLAAGTALAAARGEPADAACVVLIDALERARAQPDVAQYLVADSGALLDPAPAAFRSGDVVHEGAFGNYRAQRLEPGRDPLVDALRAAREAGSAFCELADGDANAGASVTRIRFAHPQIDDRYNPVTLLIAQATGLPVRHSYNGIGGRGFDWIYGEIRAAADADTPTAVKASRQRERAPR